MISHFFINVLSLIIFPSYWNLGPTGPAMSARKTLEQPTVIKPIEHNQLTRSHQIFRALDLTEPLSLGI